MKKLGCSGGYARSTVVLLAAISTSACLIDDPPEFTTREQTPPLLSLTEAKPAIHLVTDVARPQNVALTVPVRSEDAGIGLYAQLWDNAYSTGPTGPEFINQAWRDASSFDDLTRTLSLPWTVTEQTRLGCHRLTLFVSHVNNFIGSDRGIPDFIDDNDVATATWWFWINPRTGTLPGPGEKFETCDPVTVSDELQGSR